jgi:ribosomal-protein-alanine N-acetyltransferase
MIVNITIRPMCLDDVKQAHLIDRLSFALPWSENAFRYEILENNRSISRVAEVSTPTGSHVIVGVIVIWVILDEAHLATLSVHPEYRRLGIAKSLLTEGLFFAYQEGAVTATLEVRSGNVSAQKLYGRFGFIQTGYRKRYYRDNFEDALIFTADMIEIKDNLLQTHQYQTDAEPKAAE